MRATVIHLSAGEDFAVRLSAWRHFLLAGTTSSVNGRRVPYRKEEVPAKERVRHLNISGLLRSTDKKDRDPRHSVLLANHVAAGDWVCGTCDRGLATRRDAVCPCFGIQPQFSHHATVPEVVRRGAVTLPLGPVRGRATPPLA